MTLRKLISNTLNIHYDSKAYRYLALTACKHQRFLCNSGGGPSEDHIRVLKNKFGHDGFKPLQWSIIQSVLYSQSDAYVSLPMGYGKSLCYQYPAVYNNGLSVIVSPLIALMQDQVRLLYENKISSCFLASVQTDSQKIIRNLHDGHYQLLYITPESAMTSFGIKLLKSLNATRGITLFAIDEAHCLLHWGGDFRPSYQKLSKLRSEFPSIPIMALTATATRVEEQNIIKKLQMREPFVTRKGYNRSNLYFMTKKISSEPYGDILNVIHEDAPKYNIDQGPIIIYCLTKRNAIRIARILNEMGVNCLAYHSDLGRIERNRILKNFIKDKVKIIVATTAFGMGINKLNIRLIIHYGTPLNIEQYYQEAGRAGRDGKRSLCVLYHSVSDYAVHRYLNAQSCKSIESLKYNEKRNFLMRNYVSTLSCRREFILSHFDISSSFKTESREYCCDNCSNNDEAKGFLVDCTTETGIFLKTIESLYPKTFGIKAIIKFLRGAKTKKTLEISNGNKYYGAGVKNCEDWWKNLAFYLETEKYIKITTNMVDKILYPKAIIDVKGKHWLEDFTKGNATPIFFKNE